LADCDGGANGDVLVLHSACTIDSRYLYYVVSSDDFFLFDVGKSKGSKMPRGDKKAISSYPIPLPSIETQREIVAKLDAMQALIDSIRAEREARHKQFEHYRDRILDFPRKA
jgi:type I restriction enzyme S subunit